MLISKTGSFCDIEEEFDERFRTEMKEKIRKKSNTVLSQLRISRLSPSLLKSVCGIKSDTMLNSVCAYIEEHTMYKIVINSRGLVELRIKRKEGKKKEEKTPDGFTSYSKPMKIEYPERFIDDPKRFANDPLYQKLTEVVKQAKLPRVEVRSEWLV